MVNRSQYNKNGFRGIAKYKNGGRDVYQARISNNGKRIFLGNFSNIEDAIEARINGELKYVGFRISDDN